MLTLEALRGVTGEGGGGKGQIEPPMIFLALNFLFLTNYEEHW